MSTEAVQVGEASRPRFEFRAFGQDFDAVHFRLGRLSAPLPEKLWERRSEELYIVSRTNDANNTKLRDGKMDIKTLERTVAGFEQWAPRLKATFPLPLQVLHDEVFAAFDVGIPALPPGECDHETFLALVRAHPELAVVEVGKRRFAYMVHETICEYAEVLVNGARLVTVSTESTDPEAMRRTIVDTGMAGLENVNYLKAIKRVIGMSPMPLAHG